MSKKWSSYEKDQLLTESWRSFLETETSPNEKAEELDEGFRDKLKGAFEGKQKRPVEYPASEFTQLNVALQSANKMLGSPVVNDALTTELGDYIKSQNFVISEAEEILLGQDLPFDLTKMPTLKKLMDAAKAKPEVLQALKKQFARAGFKERPPTAAGGKPSAAPTAGGGKPSAAPTAAGGGKPPTAPTAAGKPSAAAAGGRPSIQMPPPPFNVDKTMIQAILANPDKNLGPSMAFRTRLVKYLRNVEGAGLPAAAGRNSPLIRGITKAVRDVLTNMGHTAPVKESINKIFMPVILEEINKERTRRIILEEFKRVLNEQSTTKKTD